MFQHIFILFISYHPSASNVTSLFMMYFAGRLSNPFGHKQPSSPSLFATVLNFLSCLLTITLSALSVIQHPTEDPRLRMASHCFTTVSFVSVCFLRRFLEVLIQMKQRTFFSLSNRLQFSCFPLGDLSSAFHFSETL